ncbi:Rrf2 family transcriptional regulator [Zhengella mangrovi]|uniref:Rrf2 family transcriptional regulator n=1 Tax=Zhengella mangrovi TaxID=1982044 RepID=A0A2G1QU79_9HYPH|nr:Rrf2 family transcriptional regulator [Zhengella mangrovi]PHP69020.1 Rrf2 family transcriptional regulator [Zhengella mangrovi]
MRLTTRTNLAMRTLMFCAVNNGCTVRKVEIAEACNASENHLAQVIRLLGQHGFIHAVRGRNGGMQLARPAEEINVGSVFRVFESELPFAECFSGSENHCPLTAHCWLRPALSKAVESFYETLDAMSLADLTEGNVALEHLLRLPGAAPQAARAFCGQPMHA